MKIHKLEIDFPNNFISKWAIIIVDLEINETLGLVFDVDKNSLWTVSEATSKLFNLDLKVDINRKKTIYSPLNESEMQNFSLIKISLNCKS